MYINEYVFKEIWVVEETFFSYQGRKMPKYVFVCMSR